MQEPTKLLKFGIKPKRSNQHNVFVVDILVSSCAVHPNYQAPPLPSLVMWKLLVTFNRVVVIEIDLVEMKRLRIGKGMLSSKVQKTQFDEFNDFLPRQTFMIVLFKIFFAQALMHFYTKF